MTIHWWYNDIFVKIVRDANEGIVMWSLVADQQDLWKTTAVDKGNFSAATFHRDLRDYAIAESTCADTKVFATKNESLKLLHSIIHGSVNWVDVYEAHNKLIEIAVSTEDYWSAVFHKKIKDYAESVRANDSKKEAPGPGQARRE